jgi:hypothetical protein
MRFDALLRAHAFVRVQRPPEIWEAETDDERFIPLLGELLAAVVSRGVPLHEVTLLVSNVSVEASDDDEVHSPPLGDYVAVTVSGAVDLGPDETWTPTAKGSKSTLGCLHDRLIVAGVQYAYVRLLASEGSATVFLNRL